ncbi:MAG: class I SAM-dependent methyltransferase, partial [Myxococcota bacterium]|nr:class I SAM-dependent methyltransferase [Myxococcota bacterium]
LSDLRFSDVRRAVQALSTLYVQKRAGGRLDKRAGDGAGKRAAFASYYAPLHFMATAAAAASLGVTECEGVQEIHDLGCGTGAVGAAMARLLPGAPRISGIDANTTAVAACRRTFAALGVRGRARVGRLPAAMPRLRKGALAVAGWSLNELTPRDRDAVLDAVGSGVSRGSGLLVLEPLSTRVVPWWPRLQRRFPEARLLELRAPVERPDWVARLDDATRLDHRDATCRALWLPPR